MFSCFCHVEMYSLNHSGSSSILDPQPWFVTLLCQTFWHIIKFLFFSFVTPKKKKKKISLSLLLWTLNTEKKTLRIRCSGSCGKTTSKYQCLCSLKCFRMCLGRHYASLTFWLFRTMRVAEGQNRPELLSSTFDMCCFSQVETIACGILWK